MTIVTDRFKGLKIKLIKRTRKSINNLVLL